MTLDPVLVFAIFRAAMSLFWIAIAICYCAVFAVWASGN
jgi:hypothetical protein